MAMLIAYLVCFITQFDDGNGGAALVGANEIVTVSDLSIPDDYQVGDQVRFRFLGNPAVGTVVEITATSWLKVEFAGRFGKQWTILPPGDVLGKVEPDGDQPMTGDVPANPDDPPAGGPDVGNGRMPYRVWTDNRGNEIEARLVELRDNTVRLQQRNGQTIQLKISELSIGDIRVAMRANARETFGDRAVNRPRPDNPQPDTAGYQTVTFDFSATRETAVDVSGWDLQGDQDTLPADPAHHQRFSMELNASHSGGVIVDPRVPSRGFVVATNVNEPPAGFLFDCQSGRTIGPIEIPTPKSQVLGYDAVGHRLLTSTRWSRRTLTLDVWTLTRDGIEHQFSFSPDPAGTKIPRRATTAAFIDQDRLAVIFPGQIRFYDLTRRRSLSGVTFDLFSTPQFDGTGQYAFGLIDNHVVAVDLQTGDVTGRSPVTLETTSSKIRQPTQLFSVSPDLARVATIRRRYLELFDLASGERLESCFLPTVGQRHPVFLDAENILAIDNTGASLVNIPLKSAIWDYSFCKLEPGPPGSGQVWGLSGTTVGSRAGRSGRFSVSAIRIPNESSRASLKALTWMT